MPPITDQNIIYVLLIRYQYSWTTAAGGIINNTYSSRKTYFAKKNGSMPKALEGKIASLKNNGSNTYIISYWLHKIQLGDDTIKDTYLTPAKEAGPPPGTLQIVLEEG